MSSATLKHATHTVLPVLAIAGVLYWVGGPRALREVLAEPRPGLLFAAGALFFLDRVLTAYKWNLLLGAHAASLRLWRALQIYAAANLSGLFLPSSVGPDALRTVLARREGLPGSIVVASVAVERALGFIALLVLDLAAVEVLRAEGLFANLAFIADLLALGLAAGIVVLLATFTRRSYALLRTCVPGRLRDSRLMSRIGAIHEAYVAYAAMPRTLLLFFGLTLLEQSAMLIYNWLLFGALGVSLHLATVVGILPLAVLFARLPFGGDAIGIYEAAFAGLMTLAGIDPAVSVVVALSTRIVRIGVLSPLLVSYGWRRAYTAAGEAAPLERATP